MKKYYFIFYWQRIISNTRNPDDWEPMNKVIDIDPMQWAKNNDGKNWNGGSSLEKVLQSWQEITQEQFENF